ncbi:MAG: NAD(+) synthase [Peptoniphilus sp. oral taxon 375]|uniref:NAD(+) synthase n=1 Tax=Urinicoccus timonensis TaxID=2024205 RepID=UPI00021A374A|nr:NAD(+) synthase [Urinicoccus timonensis]EGS30532.1 NAD+ synthetase [Peptoniphilus sp. oral taxon 375 str. F0436]MBS4872052.1 NAD(+) synthase [Peptoniphilus sp. oral taxon 375]
MDAKKEIQGIVAWMQERVASAKAKGLVVGLSGGVDSAVVAALMKRAFGDNALGIMIPIDSQAQDEEDAKLLAQAIDLEVERVDLTSCYDTFIQASFHSDNQMARSNIKPRLRMMTLYYYGQDRGYLVCGCSNASEFYTGYYTKYGDSGADLLPLASYLKDEVYELAKELGVPEEIIQKKPTAGLFQGQTDESEMGFSYEELNAYIRTGQPSANSEKIRRMHENSQHKREFPPIYQRKA